jgi:hypothetical protein
MKKIAILSDCYPGPGGRAENTVFGYLSKYILEQKYSLDFYYIKNEGDVNNKLVLKKYYFLNNKKFKLFKINLYKKKGLINKSFIKRLFIFRSIDRSLRYNLKNAEIKNINKYDLIIALGHSAYFLSKKLNYKKRLFIMGDPPGERLFVFNKINFSTVTVRSLSNLLYAYICFKFENYYWKWKLDFKNTKIGIFGTFTCKRFKKIFDNRHILDLRPVMPMHKSQKNYINNKKTNIVLAGSLASSFASSTMPNFFQLVKSTTGLNFKFYLIGHDVELADSARKVLGLKNLEILPDVKNFESALSKMNIFIITTKYYIGVRTRICSALCAGNYCIVTKAVLLNMPELKSCKSVLVVKNNKKNIVRSLINYHNFTYTKKINLRAESKRFFKKNYYYPVSSKKFLS